LGNSPAFRGQEFHLGEVDLAALLGLGAAVNRFLKKSPFFETSRRSSFAKKALLPWQKRF
jgi:hypothetical protein